jgi:hypothetical protein
MNDKEWKQKSMSYRMGYIEASDQQSERNCYLLEDGCKDIDEYNKGFQDGLIEKANREKE